MCIFIPTPGTDANEGRLNRGRGKGTVEAMPMGENEEGGVSPVSSCCIATSIIPSGIRREGTRVGVKCHAIPIPPWWWWYTEVDGDPEQASAPSRGGISDSSH